MTRRRAVGFALLAMMTLGSVPPLAAQGLHYEGGFGVSSGKYLFTQRTTTWSLTTGLSLTRGSFSFRVTLPAYLQNSTLVAGSGGMSIPTGGSSSGTVADSVQSRKKGGGAKGGLMMAQGPIDVPASSATDYAFAVGDPVGAIGWRLLDRTRTSLTLTGMAKAPVADTATFGTGAWDVGAALALTRQVGQRGLLGLDVSYWHLGDLPELDLVDPIFGSVSGSLLIGKGWVVGGDVSAGTSVIEEFNGPLTAEVQLGHLGSHSAWTFYGLAGLSETSPDFSLGMNWRFPIGR